MNMLQDYDVTDDFEAEEAKIQLDKAHLAELWALADESDIDGYRAMAKEELVGAIWHRHQRLVGALEREGVLDVLPDGFGFLRGKNYNSTPQDVYVSQQLIKQFRLRRGDWITGEIKEQKATDKFPALAKIYTVNQANPQEMLHRPRFENLTPLFPEERLRLETEANAGRQQGMTARVIDLVAPIGKGQR
ncbi:MAG: hypothetical protein KDC46_00285, partial [Thermoleophilia bacterium]|nr:hypothetical protein [Thermoleophilia bacterium]